MARIMSRFCSTKTMVVPVRRLSSTMMRAMSWTMEGWMPSDGSSSRISDGLPTSTRPMASCCCWPPDMVPARWLAALAQDREGGIDALVIGGAGLAADHLADPQVFLDRHARENVAALRHIADAEPGAAMRGRPLTSAPLNTIEPSFGRQQADQRPHQRRLADAVAADHRDDLALLTSRSTPCSTGLPP